MAALTSDKRTEVRCVPMTRTLEPLKLAANAVIRNGALVAVNATGFIVAASNTTGLHVVGVARASADNTGGADGAKTVIVETGGVFKFVNDGTNPVVQAGMHKVCYALDDQTVRSLAGNSVIAGIVEQIDPDGVWVLVDPLIEAAI
jgi:hypothetical protein